MREGGSGVPGGWSCPHEPRPAAVPGPAANRCRVGRAGRLAASRGWGQPGRLLGAGSPFPARSPRRSLSGRGAPRGKRPWTAAGLPRPDARRGQPRPVSGQRGAGGAMLLRAGADLAGVAAASGGGLGRAAPDRSAGEPLRPARPRGFPEPRLQGKPRAGQALWGLRPFPLLGRSRREGRPAWAGSAPARIALRSGCPGKRGRRRFKHAN